MSGFYGHTKQFCPVWKERVERMTARELTVPTRVAPAASVKGGDGACAAEVRVAVDGPRGGALPG